MSLKVIELNDSAVTVSDETGLILQSPGFALVGDKGLEVGEVAEQQARIKPTNSFNKFWHQLSLEPLGHPIGNVRHFADLAYAHLLHVAEKAELEGDVILAVPGNFTSQQLSILLGLTSQCPFNPIGVVDAALASAIDLARSPSIIYADIQLHQALLTRFSIEDGHLQRESVIQIPEVGMQNFLDLVMQLATGLFIQQCRFNPQHNAATEQQLYNELPSWLRQYESAKSSLLMELKTASVVHQAKLPWENLVGKLAAYYGKINQQIAALADSGDQVLVSSNLASLPDFMQSIAGHADAQVVGPESLGRSCIELQQYIDSSGEGYHFVTRLPLVVTEEPSNVSQFSEPASAAEFTQTEDGPTHVLFESHALPLGKVLISNAAEGSNPRVNGSGIEMAIKNMPDYLGQIERDNGEVFIVCGEAGASVNGEKVMGKKQLSLGDRVNFGNQGDNISLIRVRDGIT